MIKNFTFLLLLLLSFYAFSQSAISDTSFKAGSFIDSSLTKSVDYTSEPGVLKLQTGENENLARNKYAYIVYKSSVYPPDTAQRNGNRAIDGGFFSPSFISFLSLNAGPGGEGSYIIIDLQAIRSVNRIRMWQLGYYPGGPNNLVPNLRPRAYTIYGGLDTLVMEKLLQVPDNPFGNTDDYLEKTVDIRYLKITIDVIAQNFNTVISEIEVFGKGYLPEGFYTSSVRDAKSAVNWGRVTFQANAPEGTQISFRLRTGNTPKVDSTWSPWADSVTENNSLLDVFEPRRYCQYQIRLGTTSLSTPSVKAVYFNYDSKLTASGTEAVITPQFSPILEENTFTYTLKVNKNQNEFGIDSIILATPTPTQLISMTVNGANLPYTVSTRPDRIAIGLGNSITTTSTIEIKLKLTPFLGVNKFSSYLVSRDNPSNPQRIDPKIQSGVESWSVITTGVSKKLIVAPTISPNPFSPNLDGINDVTKIEFYLANIGEPVSLIGKELRDLTIKIYDLTGRLVKEVVNMKSLAAAFVAGNAFEWDGRGDDGKFVRPGVYLVQIYIDSGNGGEQVTKTVTVVY